MTDKTTKPPGKRMPGRPRSEATEQAVIDSTIELLERIPYRDITIDRIAATAKVGKQSIYRWWSSKAEVILEAYTQKLNRLPPLLPSPDAFADLEDDLKRFFAIMRNELIAKGVRSLVAEAQLDDDFREKFYARVARFRCEALRRIFHHGVAIGEFRDDIDFEALAHVIHGAFWYRLLSGTTYPYDDNYAETVVALIRPALAKPRASKGGSRNTDAANKSLT
jgi:AcrR family transcriptional regulator